MDSFSRRGGYSRPDAEITIRYEAPSELRDAVIVIAYKSGLTAKDVRATLCAILYRAPDGNNWSEPNVDNEVHDLIEDLQWFEVYDLVESLSQASSRRGGDFDEEINRYFRISGVGWQMVDGQMQVRGSEAFEIAVTQAKSELKTQGRVTAASELHEALLDLSRRPTPEVTGAIQHGLAALECVARDVTGSRDTLGLLVQRNAGLFPKPVDQIVEKAWAYSSNFGRHLQEGRPPQFDEAELMVGLSGVLCRYLSRRISA